MRRDLPCQLRVWAPDLASWFLANGQPVKTQQAMLPAACFWSSMGAMHTCSATSCLIRFT